MTSLERVDEADTTPSLKRSSRNDRVFPARKPKAVSFYKNCRIADELTSLLFPHTDFAYIFSFVTLSATSRLKNLQEWHTTSPIRTSHLQDRYIPSLEEYPNLYDRISDLYGSGAFISWIIVAYSAITHEIWSGSQGTKAISYDFLATLAYAVVVAWHLIAQVIRFPGSRREIWTTTDSQLMPYVGSILASTKACETAIALESFWILLVLATIDEDLPRKKRLLLLGLSLALTVAALCVAGNTLITFTNVLIAALLVTLGPVLLYVILSIVFFSILHLVATVIMIVARIRSFHPPTAEDFMIIVPLYTSSVGILCLPVGGSIPWAFWYFLVPGSKHSLSDLGQAFALSMGIFNAGFTLSRLRKLNAQLTYKVFGF